MDYRTVDFLETLDIEIENLKHKTGTNHPNILWVRNELSLTSLHKMTYDDLIEVTTGSGILWPYSRGLDPYGYAYGMYVGIISENEAFQVSFILARTRGNRTEIWTRGNWKLALKNNVQTSYEIIYDHDRYLDGFESINKDDIMPIDTIDNHVIKIPLASQKD